MNDSTTVETLTQRMHEAWGRYGLGTSRYHQFLTQASDFGGQEALDFIRAIVFPSVEDHEMDFDSLPLNLPGKVLELCRSILGSHWISDQIIRIIVGNKRIQGACISFYPMTVASFLSPAKFMVLIKAQPMPIVHLLEWIHTNYQWNDWGYEPKSDGPFSELLEMISKHFEFQKIPDNVASRLILNFGVYFHRSTALFGELLVHRSFDELVSMICTDSSWQRDRTMASLSEKAEVLTREELVKMGFIRGIAGIIVQFIV